MFVLTWTMPNANPIVWDAKDAKATLTALKAERGLHDSRSVSKRAPEYGKSGSLAGWLCSPIERDPCVCGLFWNQVSIHWRDERPKKSANARVVHRIRQACSTRLRMRGAARVLFRRRTKALAANFHKKQHHPGGDGVALVAARRRKERTYAELTAPRSLFHLHEEQTPAVPTASWAPPESGGPPATCRGLACSSTDVCPTFQPGRKLRGGGQGDGHTCRSDEGKRTRRKRSTQNSWGSRQVSGLHGVVERANPAPDPLSDLKSALSPSDRPVIDCSSLYCSSTRDEAPCCQPQTPRSTSSIVRAAAVLVVEFAHEAADARARKSKTGGRKYDLFATAPRAGVHSTRTGTYHPQERHGRSAEAFAAVPCGQAAQSIPGPGQASSDPMHLLCNETSRARHHAHLLSTADIGRPIMNVARLSRRTRKPRRWICSNLEKMEWNHFYNVADAGKKQTCGLSATSW